jgi:predicted dehydrogenase
MRRGRPGARVRAAVVGVGHLGRHHARILSSLPDVDLVAVVDVDGERAAAVAASAGTTPLTDYRDVVGGVDAAVIAVPTENHPEVALSFLDEGVGILVEKPLAASEQQASRIVEAARRAGVVLAVGHTERHNPAVRAASSLVSSPRFVEVHRLGTFPERSLDIDVVFDLMIHDIDVVFSLAGCDVSRLEAIGVPVLTDRVDIANVRLHFESGCIANLTASRISRERVRKLRLFQRDAYLSVDYGLQQLEMYRLVRQDQRRPAIEGGRIDVVQEEPLRLELVDFLNALTTGSRPLVTGEDGRKAVAVAQRISEQILESMK